MNTQSKNKLYFFYCLIIETKINFFYAISKFKNFKILYWRINFLLTKIFYKTRNYKCKGEFKIIKLDSDEYDAPLAYFNIFMFENCNLRKIAYTFVNENFKNKVYYNLYFLFGKKKGLLQKAF